MNFRRVGVLADDFSGAGDVGLAFRSVGMGVEIWTPANGRMAGFPPALPKTRVWIIDTESRSLPPQAAALAVRRALAALSHWKADFFFKKIDSTLRGPVGAELSAFIETLGLEEPVPFVPAFPRMGRTTVGGRHFVNGVPLHRTPFRNDPRHPIRSNDLNGILDTSWPSAPRRSNVPPRERVWVPDVEEDRAMTAVARRVVREGRAAVGSAGFAAALAREMGEGPRSVGATDLSVNAFGGARAPLVGVVVGSAHPLTGRQVDRFKNNSLKSGVFLVERPLRRESPGRVLRRLVDHVRRIEKKHPLRRWVVTGGETAFALARLWKEPRWRVVGAVEPGVSLCQSVGRPARWLVLKPGGFGSRDVLVKAVRRLMQKEGKSGTH